MTCVRYFFWRIKMTDIKQKSQFKECFNDKKLSFESLDWVKSVQERAWTQFQSLGFPTQKDEGWKYFNIESLLKNSYESERNFELTSEMTTRIQRYFYEESAASRLTFLNGKKESGMTSLKDLPAGVEFLPLSEALKTKESKIKPYLGLNIEKEENAFSALNAAQFEEGIFLYVPRDTVVDIPIHLLFFNLSSDSTPWIAHPRNIIVVDEGAKLNLVYEQVGLDVNSTLINVFNQIHCEKNSSVHYLGIQRESLGSYHLMNSHVYLQEGSSFEGVLFAQGGSARRDEFQFYIEGENTHCSLKGLGVLAGESKLFSHVTVHHQKPHGSSKQLFKNILADKAQSEFNSLVHVYPQAQKSDTHQLNRNLLVSDKARAYSRPQLKIEADDVQCAHGSSIGQMEEDELFYLQSRGLNKQLARFVMTFGFAEEVLEGIQIPTLKRDLECALRIELETILNKHQV